MASVRAPAVCGLFYPGDAATLRAALDDFLTADPGVAPEPAPKAIIAPHAGYVFSGAVAASVYRRVAALNGAVERVVLLGPAHRLAFRGLALSAAEAFDTPLGRIPVDGEAIGRLAALPFVRINEAAFNGEHALEVQLPFLQATLGAFSLVPLLVGDATPDEVTAVLEMLWDGPQTLIVVSSDLSHYHDYDTAVALDTDTTIAIEALRPDAITYDRACGRIAIAGLLSLARRRGLTATALDLRNSGDTAGPRDRVVGYGAYAIG